MQCKLFQDILKEKDRLVKIASKIPTSKRTLKEIDGTGGKVSVADLIAYQIGWGKCLIRWYESGIKGEMPEMPGNGFSSWNYVEIAKHFYKKYQYDSSFEQMKIFEETVSRLLEIVKIEEQKNQLESPGVWPWCTLSSGKQWPLSKWIQVNTAAPYKRASQLIQKANLD